MSLDSPDRDEATPPVLDYQPPGAATPIPRNPKDTFPGTIGLLLLLACIPAGAAAGPVGVALALLASVVCGVVQVVMSFYRVSVGDERRLRVRPGPLVLGLVPISLFLGLLFLLPQLGSPKERAQRVKCASHLRQIGQEIAMYANDNGGAYPLTLAPLLGNPHDLAWDVFICPNTDYWPAKGATVKEIAADLFEKGECSFVYLGAGMSNSTPADAVVAYEKSIKHHKDGMNVLFADGHVEWFAQPEVQRMLAELAAGHNPPRWPATQPAAAPGSTPGTGGSR